MGNVRRIHILITWLWLKGLNQHKLLGGTLFYLELFYSGFQVKLFSSLILFGGQSYEENDLMCVCVCERKEIDDVV